MTNLIVALVFSFSSMAFAGVGDSKKNWEGTCFQDHKNLKKDDFTNKDLFKDYKDYCKKTLKDDKQANKGNVKESKETCNGDIAQIPKQLYQFCCVELFKKYKRNQTLEQLAISAASVTATVATGGLAGAAATTAAVATTAGSTGSSMVLDLVKGPVEKKMIAMQCESHVADYKEFKKLLKKKQEIARLESKADKHCEKGHEKRCEKNKEKVSKVVFEVRCMGIDKNDRDIAPNEKDDCCKMLKKKRTGQIVGKVAGTLAIAAAEAGASGLGKALVTKGGLKELLKSFDIKKIQFPDGTLNFDKYAKDFKAAITPFLVASEESKLHEELGAALLQSDQAMITYVEGYMKKLASAATKAWQKAALAAGGEAALSALVRESGSEITKEMKKDNSGTDVNIVKMRIDELSCKK